MSIPFTGIVIGKFLPLHNGHISLINFARSHCEQLIVFVHLKKDDLISPYYRLCWLYQTFREDNNIKICFNEEELPESSVPSREVSKVWAEYLSLKFPEVRVIVSSEKYGQYLSEYMSIDYIDFDIDRNNIPISATKIRQNPYKYWDYIPKIVKLYYNKKVCIYGPESTGKTVLTEKLSKYYNTCFVPEMARIFLGEKHVEYNDIIEIAKLHANEITKKNSGAERVLFVDTDHITTMIYSYHYFDKCPDFPKWVYSANNFDLYLFCDIDVPWIEDIQRDSENFRNQHRQIFFNELNKRKIKFEIISGNWDERFEKAKTAINNLLNLSNVF